MSSRPAFESTPEQLAHREETRRRFQAHLVDAEDALRGGELEIHEPGNGHGIGRAVQS